MRLGLTQHTYQWLFGGNSSYFVDRQSAEYDWRGLGLPYFTRTPVTIPIEQRDQWLIERAVSLDLGVLQGALPYSWNEDHVAMIKEMLATNNIELIPNVGANLLAEGDELRVSIEHAVASIMRYKDFGGINLMKFCISPMVHNRFRREIPLDMQIRRMKTRIQPIVEAAEEADIVLAFENHLDYRASEVVDVIEHVGSDHLRFLFDMGNPFSVCEDPLEAARVAAPYTVLSHVKDARVIPWTPAAPGYFACVCCCPLGDGNVDLLRILQTLQDRAPNPDQLPASIEITPIPPYVDEDRWLEEGVKWMRAHAKDYLDGDRGRTGSGLKGGREASRASGSVSRAQAKINDIGES